MSQDAIDSFVDRNGVKQDKDYLVSSLREVYAEFQKLEGVKIDLKGLTGLSGITPVMQQAKAGADSLAVATDTVTQRIAQMNGQSKEFTQVLLTQTKAQKEAAEATLVEAKANTENSKAALNAAKSKTEAAKATAELAKAKAAEAKADLDVTRAILAEEKAQQALNNAKAKAAQQSAASGAKAIAAEAKATADAANEYKQLSLAYNEAALRAKNLQLALGAQHPLAIEAAKDANALGTQLKAVDASVGQFQRNVGNYGGAIAEFGKKTFGFIRTAANILPGLGLSGAFLLIFEGISGLVKALSTASKSIDQFKHQQELLRDISKETGKLYGEEAGKLEVLYKAATSSNVPLKERKKAVDELQQQYPDYFKNIKDETILQGGAADAYKKTKDAILEAAKARAIESKLSKLASDELEKEQQKNDILTKQRNNKFDQLRAGLRDNRDAEQRGLDQFAAISKGSELNKGLNDINNELAQIAKDREFLLGQVTNAGLTDKGGGTGAGGKTKKDFLEEIKKLDDDRRKILFEIKKKMLEDNRDLNQQILSDDKATYLEKVKAAEDYFKTSTALLQLQYEFEKSNGESNRADEKRKAIREVTDKKLRRETLLAIDAKYDIQERQLYINLLSDKIKAEKEANDKLESLRKTANTNDLKEQQALQAELDKVITDAFKRQEKLLADNYKKQKDAGDKLFEQKKKLAEDERNLYKKLYEEIGKTVTDFFTSKQDRQIADIQSQIDALDAVKQKEIEGVNASLASAQEKADQITIIEARAQAEKEQLAKKQKDLEKEKARIERLGQAAVIAGETAKGVADLSIKAAEARAQAAVLAANPLTAGLAAVALAQAGVIASQIPIVIGIGAAQLARLIIPKYKHGKNVHDDYEGPAVVGDGGRHELHIKEDGSMEVTPNRPTLTYVKKRDVILPDATKLADYVVEGKMGSRVKGVLAEKGSDLSELKTGLKEVVTAIKNQPRESIHATDRGIAKLIHWGANQTKYINDQTNW